MMTLTTPSTPRLSEVARHLIYPEGIVTSGWPRIQRRLSEMSVRYDGWQAGAAQLILGHDRAGRYVATIGGVTMSLPRQVGKTFTIGSLLIAMCIEYPGMRVVWTSHHGRTTTNTFRAMRGMVNRKGVAGYLAHNGVRTANGEQEIKFANDSIILFGAREHGFGVGIDAIDLLVCDEAQRLSSRALADMMPTTNQAQHKHGALVFFIGTPPRPDDRGDEFAARRKKALEGRMRNGIFIEFSADEDGDADDPKQWAKANASYPHRTPHESMLRMRENLTDLGDWRREAMGVWDNVTERLTVVPADIWQDHLAQSLPANDATPTAIGLDRWHDGTTAIAGAWRTEDATHVELLALDVVPDAAGVIAWITEATERADRKIPVLIAADSPAASLAADLIARKVKVQLLSGPDFARSCQAFVDDAIDGPMTHGSVDTETGEIVGQQQLDDALANATKLAHGKSGAWVWDRRSPDNDISPLVAATLARHGAVNHKVRSGAAYQRR